MTPNKEAQLSVEGLIARLAACKASDPYRRKPWAADQRGKWMTVNVPTDVWQELQSAALSRQEPAAQGWQLVPKEPTPEMVAAYLKANDAYWLRTDELPQKIGKWRTGTPSEATAESYRAMLSASPVLDTSEAGEGESVFHLRSYGDVTESELERLTAAGEGETLAELTKQITEENRYDDAWAAPSTQEARDAASDEAEFCIEDAGGMFLASTHGPRDEAWREIQHYAAQYAEDGPLTIYEVTRKAVGAPASLVMNEQGKDGGKEEGKPRFQKTYCSQCGDEFGPGDHGYSHCSDHAQRGDTLDMAYINSLPQPFMGRTLGGGWWPINDFEVKTGLIRIDVCGKLEVKYIGDFTAFRDGAGVERGAEAFYVDANEDERAPVTHSSSLPRVQSFPLTEEQERFLSAGVPGTHGSNE